MQNRYTNYYRQRLIIICCDFLRFFFDNCEGFDDSLSSMAALEFYRCLSAAASFVAFCCRQDERNYFKKYRVDVDLVRVYCVIPLNDILLYE